MAAPVHHGVSAGLLRIDNVVPGVDTNRAEATVVTAVNNFEASSANRGDYTVRVGMGLEASYDTERGILMACIAENGRDNFGTNGYPICSFTHNTSGTYRIVTFLDLSVEYNVNVAGAWFPYDRYLGGRAFNGAGINAGPNDTLTGSPGLVVGTHFKDLGAGQSIVDLRTLGIDSRTDGVLLVTHAKEEDNFALSQALNDGTWKVFVKDNGATSASAYEQDYVAFVFIPKTNSMVVSGKFLADGSISLFSGAAPQFTVSVLGEGRWELKVNGGSPTNGVLMVSPEGGGTWNLDNIVHYEPNAALNGWEIESRDTPGNGLQTPTGEPVASFVYIPSATPGLTVAPTTNLFISGPGTTASFTMALHSRPISDVTIHLSTSDPGKGVPVPSMLKITPGTWQVPRTVIVEGRNDPPTMSESTFEIVLSPVESADPDYQGLDPADVTVSFVPPRALVVAPPVGNQTTSIAPWMQVVVTNDTPGNLAVQVYGRLARTNLPPEDFTMVVLPDTQIYTAERNGALKEMFIAQTEWIITNRLERNIAYVTQLGDIVNDGDIYQGLPNLQQWRNATNAMYRLENPVRTQLPFGMPYGVAVGNHEMEPIGDPTGTTAYYNYYFGVNHFLGRSYYAGHWGTNNNNHYDFFSAGGLDFVVIYFEFNPEPQPELLAWANDILRTNALRRAIVVTHNMGNTQTPVAMSPQGTAIYNALKGNTNLFLMLGGHVTGQGSRVDTYQGRNVYTFVQDYQGWVNGGNGFLRLFEFSPSNNVVVVQTYSPWTDEWLTDEYSELYFPYQMHTNNAAELEWATLASSNAVAPGSTLQFTWPGLEVDRGYEWYVRVTDSLGGTTISPIWSFGTTSDNAAPVVVSKLLSIQGDAATNLVLTATDPNSDPVSFQLVAVPNRGLITAFNPLSGTATYTPVRGFRGFDPLLYTASDGQATGAVATLNLLVTAPRDADADGLPDVWEATCGVTHPEEDSDGDGHSNLAEYLANTNPTNAASSLRIVGAGITTNGFLGLSWDSVGGVRYRVQYSNGVDAPFEDIVRDLATEMDTNGVGLPGVQTFVDDLTLTGPATNNARYYRVRVAP